MHFKRHFIRKNITTGYNKNTKMQKLSTYKNMTDEVSFTVLFSIWFCTNCDQKLLEGPFSYLGKYPALVLFYSLIWEKFPSDAELFIVLCCMLLVCLIIRFDLFQCTNTNHETINWSEITRTGLKRSMSGETWFSAVFCFKYEILALFYFKVSHVAMVTPSTIAT